VQAFASLPVPETQVRDDTASAGPAAKNIKASVEINPTMNFTVASLSR
jgi:hypothetical protein